MAAVPDETVGEVEPKVIDPYLTKSLSGLCDGFGELGVGLALMSMIPPGARENFLRRLSEPTTSAEPALPHGLGRVPSKP